MKYTGDYNTRCPLCGKTITVGAHPVLVRLDSEAKHGKRVCPTCFKPWLTKHSNLKTEKSIIEFEYWLGTELHDTPFGCPDGYEIKGFWFGAFDNAPLGLVLNYSRID